MLRNVSGDTKQQYINHVDKCGGPKIGFVDLNPDSKKRGPCVLTLAKETHVKSHIFDPVVPEITALFRITSDINKAIKTITKSATLKKLVQEELCVEDTAPVTLDGNFDVNGIEMKPWLPVLRKHTDYFVGIYTNSGSGKIYLCVHVGMVKASDEVTNKLMARQRLLTGPITTEDFYKEHRFALLTNLLERYASTIAFKVCSILGIKPGKEVVDTSSVRGIPHHDITYTANLVPSHKCITNAVIPWGENYLYTSQCGIRNMQGDVYMRVSPSGGPLWLFELDEKNDWELDPTRQRYCINLPVSDEQLPVLTSIDGTKKVFSMDMPKRIELKNIFFVKNK